MMCCTYSFGDRSTNFDALVYVFFPFEFSFIAIVCEMIELQNYNFKTGHSKDK